MPETNYKPVSTEQPGPAVLRDSPASDDSPYLLANDGLLARKSGEWAKRKHHYYRNYCGITTKAMRSKWRLVCLDVMAGPGLCKIRDTGEEFAGSPLIALEYAFDKYIFIEDTPKLANALQQRLAGHPKANRVEILSENWINVAASGRLRFDQSTLVVAFVDPTGITQLPLSAMLDLTKNPRIDLLVTIQHSLGITWNVPQYLRSPRGQTALDAFLGSREWRNWRKEPAEFARMAIDAFSARIQQEGFIGTRHISVPEGRPLYRFTLFSRHQRAEDFWIRIQKIDETGQRELL